MAGGFDMKLIGGAALRRKLERLQPNIQKRVMRGSVIFNTSPACAAARHSGITEPVEPDTLP